MPKEYNIDEILALPSSSDVAYRLAEDLQNHVKKLNEAEQAVVDAIEFGSHIENDGMMEFIENNSIKPIQWLRKALALLGAAAHLAALEKAMTVFPGSMPPEDYSVQTDIIFDLTEEQREMIRQTGDEYLDAENQKSLAEYIHEYVINNIIQFR